MYNSHRCFGGLFLTLYFLTFVSPWIVLDRRDDNLYLFCWKNVIMMIIKVQWEKSSLVLKPNIATTWYPPILFLFLSTWIFRFWLSRLLVMCSSLPSPTLLYLKHFGSYLPYLYVFPIPLLFWLSIGNYVECCQCQADSVLKL